MFHKIKKLFQKRKSNAKIDNLFNSLNDYIITVRVGSDLVPFADFIIDVISDLRESIKNECGFIFPLVNIKDNIFYQENEYTIDIRGEQADRGFLVPNKDGIKKEFCESLKNVIYNKIDYIFTNQLVEKYINIVKEENHILVNNVTYYLSTVEIKTILSDIISTRKSINNIDYIFEKIGDQIFSNRCYNPHKISTEILKYL